MSNIDKNKKNKNHKVNIFLILGGNEERERVAFSYLFQKIVQGKSRKEKRLDSGGESLSSRKGNNPQNIIILSSGALGETELEEEFTYLVKKYSNKSTCLDIKFEVDNRAVCTVSNFTTLVPYLYQDYGLDEIIFITSKSHFNRSQWIAYIIMTFYNKIYPCYRRITLQFLNFKNKLIYLVLKLQPKIQSSAILPPLKLVGISLDTLDDHISFEIPALRKTKTKEKSNEEKYASGILEDQEKIHKDQLLYFSHKGKEAYKGGGEAQLKKPKEKPLLSNSGRRMPYKIYDTTRTVRDILRTIIWCICGIEFTQYVTLFHLDRNPTYVQQAPNFQFLRRDKISEVQIIGMDKIYFNKKMP